MFRPTNHARGVGGHDLADDKPVEEHADGGELEFDGRCRDPLLQLLDIGRDVHGLHVAKMGDTVSFAPGGEFSGRLAVGFPGVRVSDVDSKKLPEALGGLRPGEEKSRRPYYFRSQ